MDHVDLVLRGRRVVTPDAAHLPGGTRPAAVHIRRGVITAVTHWSDIPPGISPVDVGGSVLMPGLVDSHVHINQPGRTEWEGFDTATRAAAAGGVTTVVDMPLNSIPPTTTVENLYAKAAAAEGRCHVDVGLWGGVIPGNATELTRLLEAGALGFKCFMVDSGVDEFPAVTERDLRTALAILADAGAPLLCHAELPGPLASAVASLGPLTDHRAYVRYLRSRPPEAEDQAVALLVDLCRATGGRTHVVHLSSAGALAAVQRARDEGLPFTAETTPHYLHFTAETVPDGATEYKCAPPIREEANRERLWDALGRGLLDLVVSDHSPCTPELKRLDTGDFEAAWGGIASLQFGLPVIWTEARRRGHSPADIARWMCAGPAALAGLGHRKGTLTVGCDADFVVWDPDGVFTVTPEVIAHRHAVTPYLGRTFHGVVRSTWVRGQRVYEDGTMTVRSRGRWIKRGEG